MLFKLTHLTRVTCSVKTHPFSCNCQFIGCFNSEHLLPIFTTLQIIISVMFTISLHQFCCHWSHDYVSYLTCFGHYYSLLFSVFEQVYIYFRFNLLKATNSKNSISNNYEQVGVTRASETMWLSRATITWIASFVIFLII